MSSIEIASRNTPLAHSHLQVMIEDLLAQYELRHEFRNEGSKAIEAIYTFPVPLDAAFLGMEAVIGDQRRVAQVMPAKQASRQYDDAIAEGDSAVLLEQVEPGMLCVNLGNLKPGERGEIILRFVSALGVSDRRARFSLPLVHRPRYGRSELEEWIEPQSDFAMEHPLTAQIRIRGLLAGCPVQSVSQGACFKVEDGETQLDVSSSMLDRDFVLAFDLPSGGMSSARWIADRDDSLGLVTFVPKVQDAPDRPLDLCVVLDCSGSMSGDAIKQSRQALLAVAAALDERDRIQVIRFGSKSERLFRRPLRASVRVRDSLVAMGPVVQANLGGTEIGGALSLATEGLKGGWSGDSAPVIILVTDGAVQPRHVLAAQQRAVALGIRVFVVAVGSSAGVDALAPLADATRGTLERAVPAEPVDEVVMRHFRRARKGNPLALEVDWGQGDEGLPLPVAYPGDVVTAICPIVGQQSRSVKIRLPGPDAEQFLELEELKQDPEWRAWAGKQRYDHADATVKEDLALRYGLITRETSATLVLERADGKKADGLPMVVSIKQMVPEGTVASTVSHARSYARPAPSVPACSMPPPRPMAMGMASLLIDEDDYAPRRRAYERTAEERAGLDMDDDQRNHIEALIFVVLLDILRKEDARVWSMSCFMQCIPEADRLLVKRYLGWRECSLESRRVALLLMDALLESGVSPRLDDEQEAALAELVLHRKLSRR